LTRGKHRQATWCSGPMGKHPQMPYNYLKLPNTLYPVILDEVSRLAQDTLILTSHIFHREVTS